MDGKMLAAMYQIDNSLNVVIAIHNLSTTHTHRHYLTGAHIIPPIWTQGEFLQISTMKSGRIIIWKVKFTWEDPPEVVESLPAPDEMSDIKAFRISLFSPTLSHLALYLKDHFLLIWDAQNSKSLLKIPFFPSHQMTFSSHGHFACFNQMTNECYVWMQSPANYILHQKFPFKKGAAFKNLVFSPNGELIVMSLQQSIHLWHIKDPIPSNTPALLFNCQYDIMKISQSGTTAAFAYYQEGIVVLDIQSGNTKLAVSIDVKVETLGVTDSRIVVVGEGKIITWNLDMGNKRPATIKNSVQITTFNHPQQPGFTRTFYSTAISSDLSLIFTCGHHGDPMCSEIYDGSTGRYLSGIISGIGMLKLFLTNSMSLM